MQQSTKIQQHVKHVENLPVPKRCVTWPYNTLHTKEDPSHPVWTGRGG